MVLLQVNHLLSPFYLFSSFLFLFSPFHPELIMTANPSALSSPDWRFILWVLTP